MRAFSSVFAAAALLVLVGCESAPGKEPRDIPDIVDDTFPEVQAAIRANMAAIVEAAKDRDWEALRSYHLDSPKFTKFGGGDVRLDFDAAIAGEVANASALLDAMPDLEAEFGDLKIDVFGDTAVVTAFLEVTGTLPTGARSETRLRMTVVWVETADGWKIAHEHLSEPTDTE